MNPLRAFELFLLKVFVTGGLLGYYLPQFLGASLPQFFLNHPYAISNWAVFSVLVFHKAVIYPRFQSPLRNLPTTSDKQRGQLLFESPRGASALKWMRENPDAELIKLKSAVGLDAILPSGAEALRDILNTKVYEFEKPWGTRAFLARSIGFGLILSEGNEHKKQRKSLTPAFHIRRIRELYGLMWDKTGILLKGLEEQIQRTKGSDGWAVVEIGTWASRVTLDIIGPVAMGRDFQSLTHEDNPIADAFHELLEPSVDRLVFFGLHFVIPEYIVRRLPLENNKKLERIGNFLRATCDDIVQQKHRELADKDNKVSEFDILSRIMQTGEFSDTELMDQMLTFLAAGHETTASALTWVCYLCGKYPEIQEKLRAEIHEFIPSSKTPITSELLESMPYLNGVCEETQRLYPTVPATIRESIIDTTVAGHVIPKGTHFVLVPYAINRHPRFWGTNADECVPERWIDTLPDGTKRPNKNGGTSTNFSELTFLHGPRSCIGRDFAKAELRCAVAGVIGKFQIELNTKEEPKVAGVITMKPDGGMFLRFKPVEGW